MSNQQPSGPNNNQTPLETQPIRFEDINDEYIAQLLSGYWPQPQNASWGTSQGMDIPIPFSRTSMNASTSSYPPPQDSTLPAPPATVPIQGYHEFTFDELMRQIDRERELALVPQPGDAAVTRQTTSLQRPQHAQRSSGQGPGSSTQLHGFQGQPTQTAGSNSIPSTNVQDTHITAHNNNLAAPATQTSTTASRRGSSGQDVPTGTGEFLMYPCDLCPASFARKRDCQRHRRGHTGELPYACESCGESSVDSPDLFGAMHAVDTSRTTRTASKNITPRSRVGRSRRRRGEAVKKKGGTPAPSARPQPSST